MKAHFKHEFWEELEKLLTSKIEQKLVFILGVDDNNIQIDDYLND